MPFFIRSKSSCLSVWLVDILHYILMLLWKQAISYKLDLSLSLIDEETLIRSSFFCKFPDKLSSQRHQDKKNPCTLSFWQARLSY